MFDHHGDQQSADRAVDHHHPNLDTEAVQKGPHVGLRGENMTARHLDKPDED